MEWKEIPGYITTTAAAARRPTLTIISRQLEEFFVLCYCELSFSSSSEPIQESFIMKEKRYRQCCCYRAAAGDTQKQKRTFQTWLPTFPSLLLLLQIHLIFWLINPFKSCDTWKKRTKILFKGTLTSNTSSFQLWLTTQDKAKKISNSDLRERSFSRQFKLVNQSVNAECSGSFHTVVI